MYYYRPTWESIGDNRVTELLEQQDLIWVGGSGELCHWRDSQRLLGESDTLSSAEG